MTLAPREDGDSDLHRSLTQELLGLVDQSVWANRQWTEFVYSQPDPEARPRELLGHIMVGERVWFERIDGQHDALGGDVRRQGQVERQSVGAQQRCGSCKGCPGV